MQNKSLNKLSTVTLNTGNKIPQLGYGTYQLTGNNCIEGTQYALKTGYTHIDTASIYRNQEQIKTAISKSGKKRAELYITSKISPEQQGQKQSREAVEGIIARLGCQYLDLVLIHWPGVSGDKPVDIVNAEIRLKTWQTFIELQRQGKVKDIGVSNFLKHHLEHLFANSTVIPAVNQIQLHPMLWQGPTIDLCRKKNIAIEAYSPLARQKDELFKNPIILEISERTKKTPAQVCLRWSLQNGFIVLPKSKTPERIKENIQIYDFELNENDMKQMSELAKVNLRTCWDPNTVTY